ncbi:MAG: cyclic nucleotide-binding domain-containing protein [Candidatus Cloacimonadaceae bacterium]|nr:cyclic nucleotide-binding domain-containing protein [Candidatus Cloacimonadaceae bacterium]MDP3114285.1 cyclic nucleotide-binding domain-containing protein [Candidatus Cloacimonadaceae bacterium]
MLDINTLKRIPLFAALSDEQLMRLQPYLKECRFSKGSYILNEDTFGDQTFLLYKGSVHVTKNLVKGFNEDQVSTEKVLVTLKGENLPTFGENGILGHAPRNANVIAQTDCVLYTLNKTDFDSFALDNIEAAYNVMTNIARVLSMRLNSTDENLVKLATALYIAVQQ